MTVREIYQWIDTIAPFATQESFDNAGLLVGLMDTPVTGIHVALDVTEAVLDEAETLGANLLITHHPMLFSARKNMREDDVEGRLLCRMIRNRMSLIACHTNWDQAVGGINDTLAQVLGLTEVQGTGYLRTGHLPRPLSLNELVDHVTHALRTTVRVLGKQVALKDVTTIGVVGGSGGEFWMDAKKTGVQVFLTGEMHHHEALNMVASGLIGLECGHFATEEPGIFALANALQNYLNAVQYNVTVSKSACGAYVLPAGL